MRIMMAVTIRFTMICFARGTPLSRILGFKFAPCVATHDIIDQETLSESNTVHGCIVLRWTTNADIVSSAHSARESRVW